MNTNYNNTIRRLVVFNYLQGCNTNTYPVTCNLENLKTLASHVTVEILMFRDFVCVYQDCKIYIFCNLKIKQGCKMDTSSKPNVDGLSIILYASMERCLPMNSSFEKRLKELRLKYGLSQAQVAKMANVTKVTISAYENGTREPSFGTLIRLASIFGISTDYLLGAEKNLTLDISGLTEEDATIIRQLVKMLSKKNDQIKDQIARKP